MPPADQDSKKPAPSDSLLSDFDFGDDDFNWDKVGESLGPVLNSEDELPPELRRAVVPEAQPIAPVAPSPSLVAKPSEPEPAKPEPAKPEPAKPAEASPKVSPEPAAARAFDPLALPPLEGDAAPLPPILSTGLLGDLDLDLPVPPAAPVTTTKLEAKPAPAKPAVAVTSSLGELSDLALTVPSGLPSPSAVATAPSHVTPSSVAVQIEVSDEQDEDYDVQIDAAPAAEDKPSAVSDASMSDLVPGFGQATSDSSSAAAQKSASSEPSVELSLPPPPALPVIEQLPVRIEPQTPVAQVAQPAPTTSARRLNQGCTKSWA